MRLLSIARQTAGGFYGALVCGPGMPTEQSCGHVHSTRAEASRCALNMLRKKSYEQNLYRLNAAPSVMFDFTCGLSGIWSLP